MIPSMDGSHRRRVPRRRTAWQPVPLYAPLEQPSRAPALPVHKDRSPSGGELDRGRDPTDDADEISGNHVIVIDLA